MITRESPIGLLFRPQSHPTLIGSADCALRRRAHAFAQPVDSPQKVFSELLLFDRFDFGRCMLPSDISVRYLQLRSRFAGEPLDVFF